MLGRGAMTETVAGSVPASAGTLPSGASPWTIARRRLLRNRIAMTMLGVLVFIVLACLAAPLYADHVAHTDPFRSNLHGTTVVNGKTVPVMEEATGALAAWASPRSDRPGTRTTTSSGRTTRGEMSPRACSTGGATRC